MKKQRLKKHAANKKVKGATPTEYDGIKFRSKLEVYTYQELKKHGIIAQYEELQFILLEPFKYKEESIRKMGYTPDFVGSEFVIECKGQMNDAFPLRWKLFKNHLHVNNLDYDLYLPRNKKQVDEVVQTIITKRNGRTE